MRKIYLVMSDTGTPLSKMIGRYTGNRYNHISIALKEDLAEMYSFGRRNPYLVFYGGFVVESPNFGTFKRFKRTTCKICALEIEDHAYTIITDCISSFIAEKKRFGYNFRGVWKARKKINYQPSYRKFYCSQFVNYLLVCAHVIPNGYFGPIVTPEAFSSVEGIKIVYEGLLREYAGAQAFDLENDE